MRFFSILEGRNDIGLPEIFAFEEERLAGGFGQLTGEPIGLGMFDAELMP